MEPVDEEGTTIKDLLDREMEALFRDIAAIAYLPLLVLLASTDVLA